MITTIISNNCMGGVIAKRNKMQHRSPTVNLQIFPEQYARFVLNLKHYMSCELTEVKELTDDQRAMIYRMDDMMIDAPYAMCDDIFICFRHYDSFKDGVNAWERRKERIDWDNIGYVFHLNKPRYAKEATAFARLCIPKSVVLTENFSADGCTRFDVPQVPGIDAFGCYDGINSIEYGEYNERSFLSQ